MPNVIKTELTLPATERMQQLVQDYGRGLAQLATLPEDQGESLALAVWEACRNAIKHAFADGDHGVLKLMGELTSAALTISVRDQGLPFYQTRVLSSPHSAGPEAGSRLSPAIHRCFDEVRWIYHGVEGNELRLTKQLRTCCPLLTTECQATGHQATAVQPATPGNYTIRQLRPGDGIQVTRLIYRVYGYTYPRKDFYDPEWINQNIATGRLLGVVALSAGGEIVGHEALLRQDLGPLGELGVMAVTPAHRGHELHKLMADRFQEEIEGIGLIGLFGEAVTIHTISQEASERRGLHVTAINLLEVETHLKTLRHRYSPSSQWEREAEPGLQRITTVYYFKYLVSPGKIALYAPPRHREMSGKLYNNLGVKVQFLEQSHPPAGPGELTVHYDQALGVGAIQVNRIGNDTVPEISQARRDLCTMMGAKVVGLLLPLAQGGTPYLCEAAEGEGFFFSGLLPHDAPAGHFLRLQYLTTDVDPERIHLYSPLAKELLAYILQEKERVG